jgi:hypothetical protein
MFRWTNLTACLCALTLLALGAITGCDKGKPGITTRVQKENEKEKEKGKDHDHDEVGPHNGPIAEWDEIYHAEFTVDHPAKTVTVYILDDKVKGTPKVDVSKITDVKLTVVGSKPLIQLELKHDPKLSADKGYAFTGTHDYFAKPTDFKGNISGKVDKPHSGDFEYKAPKKAASLYLTPGGIYTAADIQANGNMTAAQKFKGKEWAHDDKKPGDKVCPVTNNKAEPECAWIIQGQRYEFCCHPCVDKFVRLAHEHPEKVKNANEYVFKGM